jgi:hypothetical protein
MKKNLSLKLVNAPVLRPNNLHRSNETADLLWQSCEYIRLYSLQEGINWKKLNSLRPGSS